MGTLIVYAENRPKTEVFEIGNIGAFVNMHEYRNVPDIEGTVRVGTPVPEGNQPKLPVVDDLEAKQKLVEDTLNKNLLNQVPEDETPEALTEPPEPEPAPKAENFKSIHEAPHPEPKEDSK